jgi:DNA polymerase-3 subunit delta'
MWKLQGHESLIQRLDRSVRDGRYAHAYLIVGPSQVGKATLALDLARALNCRSREDMPCGTCTQCLRISAGQHADVRILSLDSRPEGASRTEIGIDEVRELQHQANLKPYEGSHRVFIVDGAEHMSEQAANALLKTLEEPPPQVVITLLTCEEGALLATVRSRCRRLELRPMAVSQVARFLVERRFTEQSQADRLARLSMGRLGWAISALEDPALVEEHRKEVERVADLSTGELDARFAYAAEIASQHFGNRARARESLNTWLRWWRDLLLVTAGAGEFVYHEEWMERLEAQASRLTSRQATGVIRSLLDKLDALEDNANPRLALEVLMLGLP